MPVLTKDTWVLVADSEKALFLRNDVDEQNPYLKVVRKNEQDNPSDTAQSANRPGRKVDTGVGQRSALDDTDWHELAKERFAADLADKLFRYAHDGRFQRIILVAAPHVLGDLRAHLHKEVQERVVGEIDKNLANHPLDEIETLLKKELDPVA